MIDLRATLSRALVSVDLRARLRMALANRTPRRILAVGKAAGPMTDGAFEACDASIEAALVVLPDDSPAPRGDARLRVLRASHPLPDERSVAAGEAMLAFGADLALISGGASSLVFVPIDTLVRARSAMAALLASGADVREINTVRRHASLAHGGRVGLVDTLLVSDVIGGAAYDVGAGPTVFDPTTLDDARAVLARYAPEFATLALLETPKRHDSGATCEVVLGPNALAVALARELTAAGFATRVLPPTTADARAVAAEVADLALSLAPGEAMVRSAEPSVHVDIVSPGAGGRCTHLAALVAPHLAPGVVFLAAASDGVDGASGTAGALVSRESFPDRGAVDSAIAAFDTGPLHVAHGTALPLAPSGVNLTDVHALARVA